MAECEMSIASLDETNTLFEQPWWLDAVAPNAWDAVQVSSGDQVVARLAYVAKNKRGMTALSMPPLTLTLGPWLAPSRAKYANQLGQQKELMTSLIEQLPPCDYFSQYFHPSVTNWLPFYWRGFEQTTRYTYVIEALDDLERVWSEFSKKLRWEIRKAQKQLAVRTDVEDIERFLDINALTFKRQGLDLPYSRDVVRRLDAACIKHQARRMFFAEDAQGRIHAVLYFVWDKNSAYYLYGRQVRLDQPWSEVVRAVISGSCKPARGREAALVFKICKKGGNGAETG